jgi:hypothetical protein
MAKMRVQCKVIIAKEKDSFEDQLNHFLSTLEIENFVGIQYQEIVGSYSAVVLFRVKRE